MWEVRRPGAVDQSRTVLVDGLHGRSLADGRAYRTFNVIDDYARDALAIEIDASLTVQRVMRVLERFDRMPCATNRA